MVNGRILVLAASLMLAGTTVADEMQSIHIDINQVESSDELKPVDGLTSAGQPDAEEFALFAEAGYVAVVDLRGETEDRGLDEVAVLEGLGLEYVSLPLASPETINFDNASKLDEILSGFDGPVLVHCGSGNRVGALLALRESLNGASADEALQYGRDAGMGGAEPLVRSRLAAKDE